jgi:pimeloyl-ACP methyl ester carboxylesterase
MNYRIPLILIGLWLASCTAPQSVAPVTRTATLLPVPTLTLASTATSIPSPTLASTPTPAPLPTGREIIFEEAGGKTFGGTLYGEGETAILLANMGLGGEKQWNPFVAAVDKEKFTTVTFNYRNVNDVAPDMDLILSRLREEGFARVICIGASLGTRACNTIALEPEIAGLVLIAGAVHHASVAEATYPKLFIAGAVDVWAFDIQRGYEQAAKPKEVVLFDDNRAHGTDLFSSKDGEQFLTLLIDFVNGLAAP